jgi:hypothetical protein
MSLTRSVSYPKWMRNGFLLGLAPFVLLAAGVAEQDSAASGWRQVEGLGPHTRVYIKNDKENTLCYVHSVEEQQLTCGRSEAIGSPVLVFPRAEIKTIKLVIKGLGLASTLSAGYADDLLPGQLIYQR